MKMTHLACLFFVAPLAAADIAISIDPSIIINIIPEEAYCANQRLIPEVPLRRVGGNRITGYNWENNASNAGSDWKQSNDHWLNTLVSMPDSDAFTPGAWILANLLEHKEENSQSMITVPMAGYVAADILGEVKEEELAPSKRWKKVLVEKGSALSLQPDLDDDYVYVDEFINFLVQSWGSAAQGGVRWYCLDNEPALWDHTHPRIHPTPPSYEELVEKSIATALVITRADPDAKIIGPVLYGWQAYRQLQNAPDSKKWNTQYGDFGGYYLAKMKEASHKAGRRLLHAFDLHWYPEARGNNVRITELDASRPVAEARLQAARSLWDGSYTEKSWVADSLGNKPVKILKRMKERVDQYYPGTMLASTEYSYGASHHISGGLATADALGVYGREGVMACNWKTGEDISFVQAAYRLYLNYDGQGGHFGDQALWVENDDQEMTSAFAAADSKNPARITVVVINKSFDEAKKLKLSIKGMKHKVTGAWRFDANSAELKSLQGLGVLPPLSATVMELKIDR